MTTARLFTDWILSIPGRMHMTALRIRLRLLQIALHDAEITGNTETARSIAPTEARLRAQLTTTGGG
jgi:hypothetical protein